MSYPALCTGCERFLYEDDSSGPCPNCFPGLVRNREATDDSLVDGGGGRVGEKLTAPGERATANQPRTARHPRSVL
jgi:hypothetical protein